MPVHEFEERGPHDAIATQALIATGGMGVASITTSADGETIDGDELMLLFGVLHPDGIMPIHVVVPMTDEELDALPRIVADAVASTQKHRRLRAEGRHPVDVANRAAARKVTCPGCGVRLFGEVAERGGCRGCYPDLPPAEGARL